MHQCQKRDGEEDRKDSCRRDMERVGLNEVDVLERTMWKRHGKSGVKRGGRIGEDNVEETWKEWG